MAVQQIEAKSFTSLESFEAWANTMSARGYALVAFHAVCSPVISLSKFEERVTFYAVVELKPITAPLTNFESPLNKARRTSPIWSWIAKDKNK